MSADPILWIAAAAVWLIVGWMVRGYYDHRIKAPGVMNQQRRWVAKRSHDAAVALCDFLAQPNVLPLLTARSMMEKKFKKNRAFRHGIQSVVEAAFLGR
jgi:hypothetical protein